LDRSSFNFNEGPLWKLHLLRLQLSPTTDSNPFLFGYCWLSFFGDGNIGGQSGFRGPAGGRRAFLFSFVHSTEDKKSANIFLHLGISRSLLWDPQ
jgi:hypothetical protein